MRLSNTGAGSSGTSYISNRTGRSTPGYKPLHFLTNETAPTAVIALEAGPEFPLVFDYRFLHEMVWPPSSESQWAPDRNPRRAAGAARSAERTEILYHCFSDDLTDMRYNLTGFNLSGTK